MRCKSSYKYKCSCTNTLCSPCAISNRLVNPMLLTTIEPPIWIHEQAIIIFRVIDIQQGSTVAAAERDFTLSLHQSPFYLPLSHSFFLTQYLVAVKMEVSLVFYLFVFSLFPSYIHLLYLPFWCRLVRFMERWFVNPQGVTAERHIGGKEGKGRIKVRAAHTRLFY